MAFRLVVAAATAVLGVALVLAASRSSEPVPPVVDGPSVVGPSIAAVGDIACDPESRGFNDGAGEGLVCRHRATSELVLARYAGVLALGDIQYEDASYGKFLESYDPTWGRVKAITSPVPGNHEYRTAGA